MSSVEGGVSLFVVDPRGAVQSSFYDPRVPNAQWSPWFPLSDAGKTGAGAAISAVSSVPGGVSLFVVDLQGAVQTSYFDPRVSNPQWSPWARLSEPGKAPLGSSVSAVSSVEGGISLYVVDAEGAVQSSYYDSRLANPQWMPWFRLSEIGKTPAGTVATAVSTVPGGVSLFVVDTQNAVQSAYFDPHATTDTPTPFNVWLPHIQQAGE